jgi:hypothetical protein
MKWILVIVLPIIFGGCASQPKTIVKKEVVVNEDFYSYYKSEGSADRDTAVYVYQLKLVSGSPEVELPLLNAVQALIIEKSFLSSQIFPEGSLFRKRIHSFALDTSSKIEGVINAQVIKDEKYSSYKLLIEKRNPKKKEELFRRWLFPDNLSQDQLAIRIARTIVRYSFEEL